MLRIFAPFPILRRTRPNPRPTPYPISASLAELADQVLKSSQDGGTKEQSASGEETNLPGDRGGNALPASAINAESTAVPLILSRNYFRSVAEAIMQAAEALQHAHAVGILH